MEISETRRGFVRQAMTAALTLSAASNEGSAVPQQLSAGSSAQPSRPGTGGKSRSFLDLLRDPDSVRVFTEQETRTLHPTAPGVWEAPGIEVATTPHNDSLHITL